MHSQSFFIFFFALLVPSFLQVTGSAFLLWCLPSHLPPTRLPSCLPAFVPSQGSDPIFPGSRAQLQASSSSINSSQAPSIFLLFSSSQPPNHTLHPTTSSPPRTNTSRPWGILFSCSPATSTTAYREFKASIRFWVPNICIFFHTNRRTSVVVHKHQAASECLLYLLLLLLASSFSSLVLSPDYHISIPYQAPIHWANPENTASRGDHADFALQNIRILLPCIRTDIPDLLWALLFALFLQSGKGWSPTDFLGPVSSFISVA